MNKYFLIDIDGCITNGKNKNIDLEHFSELKDILSSSGIKYSLCTGRSATYVESIAQFLSFDGWSICENGSYLYHSKSDEILSSHLIGKGFQETMAKIKENISLRLDAEQIKYEMGKEMSLSINPMLISVEELHKEILAALSHDFLDLVNVDYSTTAVDITAKGVSKKSGLLDLTNLGAVQESNYLIGVGDSSGDLPFLEECNYPTCPKNATPPVKKLAAYISKYDSTQGLVDIIKHSILLST